jgi:thiol-disulfide isomerase/thioredoxin
MKISVTTLVISCLLLLSISNELSAFTLIIKSSSKLKNLKIAEHHSTSSFELSVGSNEIKLVNYPNAIYLFHKISKSNYQYLPMLWVATDTSTIEITIDADYQLSFRNESVKQQELNKIFSSSNVHSLFPYEAQENLPLEPILALEAKAIIQNLSVATDKEVLAHLLKLSRQRNIDNWATDVLSTLLYEPAKELYNSGKLTKIIAKDSLQKQIELIPGQEKYLFVAISASWCGPCIKGIPNLRKSYDETKNKISYVSLWNDPNINTFLNNHSEKKNLIQWPSLWDQYGVMANALNITVYPTYILFDASWVEVNRWEGKLPKNFEEQVPD